MTSLRIEAQTYDVDAILFDKDGTLLDLNGLWSGWLSALCDILVAEPMLDVELDKVAIYSALGVANPADGLDAVIDPRGPLAIGSMDDVLSIMAQTLYQQHQVGWNDAVRWVQHARSTTDARLDWEALVKPVRGVQSFVAAAHAARIPMGVVTSDEHKSAAHHLACLGIEKAVSVVIGHDDVTQGKPFPEMIFNACKALGVLPERTLLFGDSNGDMQMARTAALVAGIGLAAPGWRAHLTAADQVIEDYTQCRVVVDD